MRLVTYSLPLVTLVIAMAASGCTPVAQSQPVPPPPAPIAQIAAPPDPAPDEWNVLPDPMSGNVEVYHNGESVGSITGDEKEDPPIPHPVKDPDHPDPVY
jgi:hypothetical protein